MKLLPPVASASVVLLLAVLAGSQAPAAEVLTSTLPNGLTVMLHPDHSVPQVVVNLWYKVGAKDEAPGRTGFAHLFEHLMFMGTSRVPGNQFDLLMESGGGANNASTNEDRTNYFSWGPPGLLPTLLWLDADRMEGLGRAMTAEKLDLQRSVVRNERRQGYENRPYGAAWLLIPDAMYPEGHPYHHPVIGSHEDLEAASLADVQAFFASHYLPANASLVVAGDFEPAVVTPVIAELFGAVPAQPAPSRRAVPPATLDHEVRRFVADEVADARLYLVWHSPAAFAAGDAEMDLLALVLADGDGGRLHRRLVLDDRLAREVQATQSSGELGSTFRVQVTAADGADLARIKVVVLEELDRLVASGPDPSELERARAVTESGFLRRRERLLFRADMLNQYWHVWGVADGFERDLARLLAPTPASVQAWAGRVLGPGRLDLRIVPKGPATNPAALDARPADLPAPAAQPAAVSSLRLANGIPLHVAVRPGSGLFAGALLCDGGERVIPAEQAGLAELLATLLTSGAGSRDASAYAEALAALGARVEASPSWHDLTVRVRGLSSRLAPTLDLFADAIVRPRLAAADVERERALALAAVRARAQDPDELADVAAAALAFGRDDPRGRPAAGWAETVSRIEQADLRAALSRLLHPERAALVFAGDLDPDALRVALDARLGGWHAETAPIAGLPEARTAPQAPGLVLVDRPGAEQTVIRLARPAAVAEGAGRLARATLDTLLGGTFTSRLNQNLRERHGYTYGAHSSAAQDGTQFLLGAETSVQTAVTGAALAELRGELAALATGDVGEAELAKARRTVRFELENAGATAGDLAELLTGLVANGRPPDSPAADLDALAALTLEGVNGEARSGLFAWDSYLVVLVGDAREVLPQLEGAGFTASRLVDAELQPVSRPTSTGARPATAGSGS